MSEAEEHEKIWREAAETTSVGEALAALTASFQGDDLDGYASRLLASESRAVAAERRMGLAAARVLESFASELQRGGDDAELRAGTTAEVQERLASDRTEAAEGKARASLEAIVEAMREAEASEAVLDVDALAEIQALDELVSEPGEGVEAALGTTFDELSERARTRARIRDEAALRLLEDAAPTAEAEPEPDEEIEESLDAEEELLPEKGRSKEIEPHKDAPGPALGWDRQREPSL